MIYIILYLYDFIFNKYNECTFKYIEKKCIKLLKERMKLTKWKQYSLYNNIENITVSIVLPF